MSNVLTFGTPGTKVPLLKLDSDGSYQRRINLARVNQIAEHFNPLAIRTFVVSKRGAKFFIIDGQHRWMAIKTYLQNNGKSLRGVTVTAEVHVGLNTKQEAELYRILNDNKPVRGDDLFRADLYAGKQDATAVLQIAQKYRFTVHLGGPGRPPWGMVRNPGVVREVYNLIGKEALDSALYLISKAFRYDNDALTGTFIKGLSLFFKNTTNVHRDTIVARLKEKRNVTARDIVRRAYGEDGWGKYQRIANCIADVANLPRRFNNAA